MPEYMPPRNDTARLGFLIRVLKTGRKDLLTNNHYVTKALLNAIEEFLPPFEKRVNIVSSYRGNRSREIGESTEAFRRLQIYVRDMWNVLKRRVKRLNQPPQVLIFYGLPMNGKIPTPANRNIWLIAADKLVKGDQMAVEAGYPPMSNPSAGELEKILKEARREYAEAIAAESEYDSSQAELQSMRLKADELIKDVMAELRFYLRHLERPSQRRIMRTYGVTFRYRKEEPEEEVPEEEEKDGTEKEL
jgi:hypothetical protein